MENNYDKFIGSYQGRNLLLDHSLEETGTWEVRGEDSNCDFGGHHHEPFLGHFQGKLEDVIRHAVEIPGFWTWGGGGRILSAKSKKVIKIKNKSKDSTKLGQKSELQKKLTALEAEVAKFRVEIKKL